ncbi:hypothetical protein U5801_21610 [Lamprobacter modestohalophilus]|uniref:YbjN domain-containing protein n=1 Tax=Lamprobacter modestohalophilus TaxID=1064514 RepID=UPI002ADEE656|nr:YbjN domain-containing protein [Lamprobacter modestohalophilus]MEA1052382.1 hypothetical protein [Lamprobacter modestohalophilus]
MATSLDTIARYLDDKHLSYEILPDQDIIVTGMQTETYRDRDGDPHLQIAIELGEQGEFFRILVPNAFQYQGENKYALMQLCMMIHYRYKFVRMSYDDNDGEFRAEISFPIEDSELTSNQFYRIFGAVLFFMEHFYSAFKTAIESGKIELSESNNATSLMELLSALRRGEISDEALHEIVQSVRTTAQPEATTLH